MGFDIRCYEINYYNYLINNILIVISPFCNTYNR